MLLQQDVRYKYRDFIYHFMEEKHLEKFLVARAHGSNGHFTPHDAITCSMRLDIAQEHEQRHVESRDNNGTRRLHIGANHARAHREQHGLRWAG